MQTFNIDISRPGGPLVLYASQGDSCSRFFAVTVTDNGAAYEPPTGAVYTVRFGAPGMPAGWYDTIEETGGGTHAAVTVNGSTITVELAEQAVSAPGTNAVVLVISDADGYTLASWAWTLMVAAVPGYTAPEVTVYYNALTAQVAETLTNAQAAAGSATAAAASAALAQQYAESVDPSNLVNVAGGTTGQVPQITGEGEYEWAAIQQVPTGGAEGQVLQKSAAGYGWGTLTPAGIGAATAAQGELAASAVQSVNGKSGTAVTLSAADVGAAAASASNLKTYSSVTQLGIVAGAYTTAQVYDAMPGASIAMLIGTDVSDAPTSQGTLVIYKYSLNRGRIVYYDKSTTSDYYMLLNTSSGPDGATGVWVAV